MKLRGFQEKRPKTRIQKRETKRFKKRANERKIKNAKIRTAKGIKAYFERRKNTRRHEIIKLFNRKNFKDPFI